MYITICEIDCQSRSIHETLTQGQCTGMTLRDGMGREVAEGFRMGDTWQFMSMYVKNHYNVVN